MSYEIIRVHSYVPLTWTPAKKCWETIAWWEFRIVFPGWSLLETALTSHAAVGVKLRTALSRTFPSWQKLQPTLASIESNLATWGTSPHLSKLQFVSREPWNNRHLVLVSYSCWRCKSLPTAFPGSRGRFREYATRIHNTSISKFTWSTKWFSLLSSSAKSSKLAWLPG